MSATIVKIWICPKRLFLLAHPVRSAAVCYVLSPCYLQWLWTSCTKWSGQSLTWRRLWRHLRLSAQVNYRPTDGKCDIQASVLVHGTCICSAKCNVLRRYNASLTYSQCLFTIVLKIDFRAVSKLTSRPGLKLCFWHFGAVKQQLMKSIGASGKKYKCMFVTDLRLIYRAMLCGVAQ